LWQVIAVFLNLKFLKVKGILKILKILLFPKDIMNVIMDIMEKAPRLVSEILSHFNFIIGIFTLEQKLSSMSPPHPHFRISKQN